jgi:hypothetical protein
MSLQTVLWMWAHPSYLPWIPAGGIIAYLIAENTIRGLVTLCSQSRDKPERFKNNISSCSYSRKAVPDCVSQHVWSVMYCQCFVLGRSSSRTPSTSPWIFVTSYFRSVILSVWGAEYAIWSLSILNVEIYVDDVLWKKQTTWTSIIVPILIKNTTFRRFELISVLR